MKPTEDNYLLELVKATGELYGKQVSLAAALMFVADLEAFSSDQIKASLAKCRKELRTFPTVADVIARIDDGRPGVEEAWAMIPQDESASVVWTDEIAQAYGVARGLMADDPVAARMAFKETYQRLVADARSMNKRPHWTPSFGIEKSGREAAVIDAVSKGRLTQQDALALLPEKIAPVIALPNLSRNGMAMLDFKGLLQRIEENTPLPEIKKETHEIESQEIRK